MNDTDKRIAELEKELAELKKQRNTEKEYVFNEKDTDIVVFNMKNYNEKYFSDFKKLFEAIKKTIKNKYKFSIWYKRYDSTEEFNKQWNIDNFNENEIFEIFSSMNAYEILTGEFCISNKMNEILYQICFRNPFLTQYDEIIFQRRTTDKKKFRKIHDEGEEWRLFK